MTTERYIKASDVKKMISTNSAMKRYFPWAENMFLNLIDDIPEADVVPLEWINQWLDSGERIGIDRDCERVTDMLNIWRNRNGTN